MGRVSAQTPASNRAVTIAADLYERARLAASDHGPARATRLFHRALHRLDAADRTAVDALELRTRVLISLAYAESETTSLKAGLVHIDAAGAGLRCMPAGVVRTRLETLCGLQHALMLVRAGRPAHSLPIFDALLPVLEEDLAEDGSLLATTLSNRGLAHLEMGNPVAALVDLRRGLELAVRHGHRNLEAKAWHNLGDQAQLVGDIPGALRCYDEAARIFGEVGPGSLPRIHLDQARALLTAGLAEEAARHLDEALPRLRENRVMQDFAEAEVSRAAAAILEGDYASARQLASDARRRFLRKGNERWAEVAALTRLRADAVEVLLGHRRSLRRLPAELVEHARRLAELGLRDEASVARLLAVRLYLRLGSVDEAERLLAQVPQPRQITPIDHVMMRRLCRAELAVVKGNSRVALAQARAGFAELARVRDRMGGLDLVCGTAVHGQELGRIAVRLVLDSARGHAGARRVFAWQERTRAQVYRYEPLPAIADAALANLIAEMRHVQRMAQQSRLEGRPAAGFEQRYVKLQREAARLGWHTSPWGRPRPVSAPEALAGELGDRVMVSISAEGERLTAVVVRDGRFRLVRLGPSAEIEEITKQLHADLNALAPDHLPSPLVAAVTASAEKRANLLDELLVRPLDEAIGDRELVIVPIGPLYALPWAALPSLRGRPLSITPSATAWMAAAGAAAPESVVLVGGPGVPGSVGEVDKLRSVYPRARLIDGEAATSSAVLSALDGAGLAHLVAHGAHEPGNALFSRLELVDGPLFAHETASLGHPPELVVLAACELAMSHIRPGEEALGFAGALLASGSRSVVGAISRVGDRAAADAMADLHRRLATGTSPALALAQSTAVDPLRRPFLCLGAG